MTFLSAPPSSQPMTSSLVYTRNVGPMKRDWMSRATASSPIATTVAVGWPATISATRLGPVMTPVVLVGEISATTSVIRARVSCSIPLVRLRTGTPGSRNVDTPANT
jgi:hypothetical protein